MEKKFMFTEEEMNEAAEAAKDKGFEKVLFKKGEVPKLRMLEVRENEEHKLMILATKIMEPVEYEGKDYDLVFGMGFGALPGDTEDDTKKKRFKRNLWITFLKSFFTPDQIKSGVSPSELVGTVFTAKAGKVSKAGYQNLFDYKAAKAVSNETQAELPA